MLAALHVAAASPASQEEWVEAVEDQEAWSDAVFRNQI